MTRPELALSRFRTAVLLDLRLQWRYGFYYAGAFVTVVWIVLLRLLPPWTLVTAAPFVIFSDLAVVGYYFIAALALYEKGEATLFALVVTPLRFWEYLAARVTALTLLSLAMVAALAAAAGAGFNPLLLLLSAALTAVIAALAGFIAVAPFTSISSYLLPSGLPLVILGLPLLPFFGVWQSPLFFLLPTYGPLLLLGGAFAAVEPGAVLAGVLGGALWVGLLAWGARRAFDRFIITRTGGR